MSQSKEDQLANFDKEDVELGTAKENESNDDTSIRDDEPEGQPPANRVKPDGDKNTRKSLPPPTSGSNEGDQLTPHQQATLDKTAKADDFDDDENLNDTAVKGNGKVLKYSDDNDKTKKRNKPMIIAAVLILLFALLLTLGLLFSKKESPQNRSIIAVTDAPTQAAVVTRAPTTPTESTTTRSPTQSPTTKAPTPGTRSPTMSQGKTGSPTSAPIAPTFGPPGPVSRLSCAELRVSPEVTAGNLGDNNFEVYTLNKGRQVCGDTYAGKDPSKPNRNVWTATIGRRDCVVQDFHTGTATCEAVGARRCTADELAQKAAQGSGCGGDNFLLWTSTSCVDDNDADGYLQINLSLRNNGTYFRCQPNLSEEQITRCCGDIF